MSIERVAAAMAEALLSAIDDPADDAYWIGHAHAALESYRQLTKPDCTRACEDIHPPRCPRPANGRPANFDMDQCLMAGECGCMEAAAAFRAQPAPVAVPEGWKLVPVELNSQMRELLMGAWRTDGAERAWRTLLAAAPQPPVQQAEPAPAQDERKAFEAWFLSKWPANQLYRRDALPASDPRYDEYCNPHVRHAYEGWQARATRPAQTEQQPVAWRYKCRDSDAVHVSSVQWTSQSWPADWDETPLYAAPIAQTAPSQPEQSEVQRLRSEHAEWASIFGSALMAVMQEDYGPITELAMSLPLDFHESGSPVLRSAALSAHRAQQEGE